MSNVEKFEASVPTESAELTIVAFPGRIVVASSRLRRHFRLSVAIVAVCAPIFACLVSIYGLTSNHSGIARTLIVVGALVVGAFGTAVGFFLSLRRRPRDPNEFEGLRVVLGTDMPKHQRAGEGRDTTERSGVQDA